MERLQGKVSDKNIQNIIACDFETVYLSTFLKLIIIDAICLCCVRLLHNYKEACYSTLLRSFRKRFNVGTNVSIRINLVENTHLCRRFIQSFFKQENPILH